MKNIEIRVEGNKIIITADLTREYGLSSSGKSLIIASTDGNVPVPGHEHSKVGVNLYRPRPKNGAHP